MKEKLPENLGGEFWFSLSMVPVTLFFAYLAVSSGSGRNLAGSLFATALFIWRLYDRVQKVRLARFLKNNAEIQRIYQAWDGDQ